jgi:colicin import membrane protein
MSAAALQRDAFMPRQPRGMRSGLALALLVHVLLVAALAFSVRWRASTPAAAEAELWAAVPQAAAPRAVEVAPPAPTPPPVKRVEPAPRAEPEPQRLPDPQIAIEKEKARREKLQEKEDAERAKDEKKKLDKEKAREKLKEDEKLKAEQERKAEEELVAARERNIKRILGEAGATGAPGSAGAAARSSGPSAGYAGRVKARLKPNVYFPDKDTVTGDPVVEVSVVSAPDGTVMSRKVVKGSGLKSWDDAVLAGIDKMSILPRDDDGRVPSPLIIVYSMRD